MSEISPAIRRPPLVATPALAALSFFIAGGLKIVYDILLWIAFRARPAPEEAPQCSPVFDAPRCSLAFIGCNSRSCRCSPS